MNAYKMGSFASDVPGIFPLCTQGQTDANYCALWKPGVKWIPANAYSIPSGKTLTVVAFYVCSSSGSGSSFVWSLGYGDNAQVEGIGGGSTAPTNAVSVFGDTTASTIAAMGGILGASGTAGLGFGTQPFPFLAPEMWPVAAATKYPFARLRGPSSVEHWLTLWVLEV